MRGGITSMRDHQLSTNDACAPEPGGVCMCTHTNQQIPCAIVETQDTDTVRISPYRMCELCDVLTHANEACRTCYIMGLCEKCMESFGSNGETPYDCQRVQPWPPIPFDIEWPEQEWPEEEGPEKVRPTSTGTTVRKPKIPQKRRSNLLPPIMILVVA